jgi:cytochrome c oxidase subunit 1/cytochrome c oxidase subunit I+III
MPRRIYTYSEASGWGSLNLAVTLAAFVFALGVLVTFANALVSLNRGRPATANPWHADSLEWSIASPPPAYAFLHIPTVTSRHPLWDAHDEAAPNGEDRVLDRGRLTLATSWLQAQPRAIAKMPEDTPMPLLVALGLAVLFTGLLLKALVVTAAFVVALLILCAAWLWPERERVVA